MTRPVDARASFRSSEDFAAGVALAGGPSAPLGALRRGLAGSDAEPASGSPAPGLAARSDLHLARKAFHATGVLAVAVVYQVSGIAPAWALALLALVGLPVIAVDLLRLRVPALNARVKRDFVSLLRTDEQDRPSALTWFFAGAALTIALFPRPIAAAGLVCLAFADPAAALVGQIFGSRRILGRKTLEGSFAALLAGLVATILFLGFADVASSARLLLLGAVAGVASAVAEAIPFGADDNFRVPITVAAALGAVLVRLT